MVCSHNLLLRAVGSNLYSDLYLLAFLTPIKVEGATWCVHIKDRPGLHWLVDFGSFLLTPKQISALHLRNGRFSSIAYFAVLSIIIYMVLHVYLSWDLVDISVFSRLTIFLLQIGPNVTIGKNCVIGPGARVRQSIVLDGAEIGVSSTIQFQFCHSLLDYSIILLLCASITLDWIFKAKFDFLLVKFEKLSQKP